MKGEVMTREGKTIALPELISYRLLHTDGSSADSFEVTFPTRKSLLPALRTAADFRCKEDGKVRFRGVIDEVETVFENAFTTTLCGRGMAAKLMDNQVEGAEFYSLDLGTVLDRYVRPYGLTSFYLRGGPWRAQMLSVGAGSTCQQVLQGFCLHAGAPQPRFLSDGVLCIAPAEGYYTIGETQVLSARWRFCRYGVISRQKVIDLSYLVTRTAENSALQSLGIDSRRVATRSGPFTRITERSAQQRLAVSAKGLDTLELMLPGAHPAQPCDTIRVSLPSMCVDGEFTITEACRRLDGTGETTQLCLRAKEL